MCIIKIVDLTVLCVPKFTKTKTKKDDIITRKPIIDDKSYVHFINKHHVIHFRNLKDYGFTPENKIRYYKHDSDSVNKFYIQCKTPELLTELEKKQFYSLSKSKNDTCSSGTGLWETVIKDVPGISSFNSCNLIQVLSDEGWLLEVDITGYNLSNVRLMES